MTEENSVGRPPHKPTSGTREKVGWRIAAGFKLREIALEFGISVPTLRSYYLAEIETGWAKNKGKTIDLMVKGAKAGNASLQKKLLDIINAANPGFGPNPNDESDEENADEQKPGYVSKKATQLEEAQTAGQGTDWAGDLSPPASKIVN